MSPKDTFVLATRSVTRRAGRVALTMLAVALATALLIALLTIATTAKSRVLNQITKGGPLAGITVQGGNLDSGAVRRIESVPNVVDVSPVVGFGELVLPPDPPTFHGSPTASMYPFPDGVVGVDLAHAARFPISIIAGRLPTAGSMTEAAVTEGYLAHLGLTKARAAQVLGTELELGMTRSFGEAPAAAGRWTRAVIVGVVAQDAGPGDVLVPIQQADAAWRFSSTSAPPLPALMVQARSLDDVTAVRERIGALGYDTIASETLLTNVVRYVHVVEIVLTSIGVIALVIAALGITNAMLAAIRERRREIGVLKAIGARDRDVLGLFLIEAAVVGAIGGVLGTVAGWGAAQAVGAIVNRYLTSQGLATAPIVFPLVLIAGGVLGATFLAAAAGILPARRAAGLPAVEAMEAT